MMFTTVVDTRPIDPIQARYAHTFGSGYGGHTSGPGSDVVDNGSLNPGDHEVGTFSLDVGVYSLEPIEDYGSVATVHCKGRAYVSSWVIVRHAHTHK